MAHFDFCLEELLSYKPERNEPEDFDVFWASTLQQTRMHPLTPQFNRVDFHLNFIEVLDVTFNGFDGQSIKGWFLYPKNQHEKIPCVVEYIGYGSGRSFPYKWLLWASMGYAHFVMDTRGQGSVWSPGDTPDFQPAGSNPHVPGFMTLGIEKPENYYYRRVFCDAVRAVETVCTHEVVDPTRIAVVGSSQGGGIALAVSGLIPKMVQIALADVPFLCHFRRATTLVDTLPYLEISQYCKIHRDQVNNVFRTLSYFDGMNFAARTESKALFSVGLMDDICPPSTVFAAYNHYSGPKEIRIWEFNQHEGGDHFQEMEKANFLHRMWG